MMPAPTELKRTNSKAHIFVKVVKAPFFTYYFKINGEKTQN